MFSIAFLIHAWKSHTKRKTENKLNKEELKQKYRSINRHSFYLHSSIYVSGRISFHYNLNISI